MPKMEFSPKSTIFLLCGGRRRDNSNVQSEWSWLGSICTCKVHLLYGCADAWWDCISVWMLHHILHTWIYLHLHCAYLTCGCLAEISVKPCNHIVHSESPWPEDGLPWCVVAACPLFHIVWSSCCTWAVRSTSSLFTSSGISDRWRVGSLVICDPQNPPSF